MKRRVQGFIIIAMLLSLFSPAGVQLSALGATFPIKDINEMIADDSGWVASAGGNVIVQNGTVTTDAWSGAVGYSTTMLDQELLSFNMKIDIVEDAHPWIYLGLNNTYADKGLNDPNASGYALYILRNGTKATLALNKFINGTPTGDLINGIDATSLLDGRFHLIQFGTVSTTEGVAIIVYLNGKKVIDFLDDSLTAIAGPNYFTMVTPGDNTFQLRGIDPPSVAIDGFLRDGSNWITSTGGDVFVGKGILKTDAWSGAVGYQGKKLDDQLLEMEVKFDIMEPSFPWIYFGLNDSYADRGMTDPGASGYALYVLKDGSTATLAINKYILGVSQGDLINGIDATAVLDGKFHTLKFGTINTDNGVSIVVILDGVRVIDIIDSANDAITADKYFTMVTPGDNRIQLADTDIPWWDNWPRFGSPDSSRAEASSIHASAVVAPGGDEGRGPYFRDDQYNHLYKYYYDSGSYSSKIRQMVWMESMGTAITFLGAVTNNGNGTYVMDSLTGAPQLVSHIWSWNLTGPDVNPAANEIVWIGPHSYANSEEWQGIHAMGSEMDIPTYPDNTPATGYFNNDPSDPRNAKFYDAIAAKDINGDSSVAIRESTAGAGKVSFSLPGGGTGYSGYMTNYRDVASPWWSDYNRLNAKYFISKGLDGFWVDHSMAYNFMLESPVHKAFGDWSVASFREFLSNHPELGITNPSTFDIRDYLKDKFNVWFPGFVASNLNSPQTLEKWADPRWVDDPIWKAYLAHKAIISGQTAAKLYSDIKNEAISAGRNPNDILVSGNDIPRAHIPTITGEELDIVSAEYTPNYNPLTRNYADGLPPNGHSGPFYALATQAARGKHANIWYYLEGGLAGYRNNETLAKVISYEALANNAIIAAGSSDLYPNLPGTDNSASEVNQFIERMEPVFGQRQRIGSVGLLYSTQSEYSYLAPGGYRYDTSNGIAQGYLPSVLGYYGWGTALEKLRIPYRAISDYKLNSAALDDISVLILPHVRSISTAALNNVIVPFIEDGGTIIVTGDDSGLLEAAEELYHERSSASLYDLTQVTYTNGSAVFVSGSPDADYYISKSSGDLSSLAGIIDDLLLANVLQPEIELTGGGSKVVATINYDYHAERMFIDLVNRDIHLANDTMTAATAVTVEVKLPDALRNKSLTVKIYNPALSSPTAVTPTVVDSSTIQITVPSFDIYSSITIE